MKIQRNWQLGLLPLTQKDLSLAHLNRNYFKIPKNISSTKYSFINQINSLVVLAIWPRTFSFASEATSQIIENYQNLRAFRIRIIQVYTRSSNHNNGPNFATNPRILIKFAF